MDGGTTLVKYTLFVFNTLVSILGVIVIINGVLVLESINVVKVGDNIGYPPQALVPIGLIAIGSIVVLISLCGCCGAIQENVCNIMCYAVFMLILLILQLIVVVLLWINKEEISEAMGRVIASAWPEAHDANGAEVFEAIQKTLKCCGVNGSLDYVTKLSVPPPSCCEGNSCFTLNYYPGCRDKFVDLVTGSTDNARHFGLSLIVVELIGLIFACCLASNIRKYKQRNIY